MTPTHTRRSFLSLATVAAASVGLTGCSLFGVGRNSAGSAARQTDMPAVDGSRTLVAYFSVPETTNPNGMTQDEENSTHVVDGKVYGNTQYVAMLIAGRLGAAQFRIETAEQLPLNHQALIDRAVAWQDANARPALKAQIPNLGRYDTVIVGYPIWEYDMPMPLYTFFEQHDFSGKNIYVFTTHDVSGLSGTLEKVTEMLPRAKVSTNAFEISRNDMNDSQPRVTEWVDRIAQA
ncbi:flavodoxin [Streptomyces sp. NPDC058045]|uniref:flavodoxin n=1 Tax=Streptomyces sp. NPDC058045 TaxID=3346311 RepID=UPI0036F15F5E